MVGLGTNNTEGLSNFPNYIDFFQHNYDVKEYGLVKDSALITLMQKA